ncbi:hypothetical protein L7F22_065773 [Adiantum nelumboides]|nr:hypothetical protein [Adiantum nelumboides]
MIRALQENVEVTLECLRSCSQSVDLKKWRRLKDGLRIGRKEDDSLCPILKTKSNLRISCIEDWANIVRGAHFGEGGGAHRCINDTIEEVKSKWYVGIQKHGIPIAYIKDFVNACECKCLKNHTLSQSWQHNTDINKQHSIIVTTTKDVEELLKSIMIKYKTRLL